MMTARAWFLGSDLAGVVAAMITPDGRARAPIRLLSARHPPPHHVAAWPRSPPGGAVGLRIPSATFQMQTQTVRGYPAPGRRRVLGRLRTCRVKG
jgi:hypothetical protein